MSLNSSVKDIISGAIQSGSLPASTGSVGGVATSNSNIPSVFTSPQVGSVRSIQTPGAPVKAPQNLGSGSMGLNGLFGNQSGSVKPTNLFGTQSSSLQSPVPTGSSGRMPGAPVKVSQNFGSGTMGTRDLFGSQQSPIQPTNLFGSQSSTVNPTSSLQQSPIVNSSSGSQGNLFGSSQSGMITPTATSPQTPGAPMKVSQSLGSGSMGLSGLFGGSQNQVPSQSGIFGGSANSPSQNSPHVGLFGGASNAGQSSSPQGQQNQSIFSGGQTPQSHTQSGLFNGSQSQLSNSMNSKISSLRKMSQSQLPTQSLDQIEASQAIEAPTGTFGLGSSKPVLNRTQSTGPNFNSVNNQSSQSGVGGSGNLFGSVPVNYNTVNQVNPPVFGGASNSGSLQTGSGSLSVKDKLNQLRSKTASLSTGSQNRASSPPKSISNSMSQLNSGKNSHVEEQFKIDNVVEMEVSNDLPKVVDHEDPLAPHMKVFLKHGISVDKVLPDHDSNTFFVHAYTRGGASFVIEIKHRQGATLYLNDGTILEKHEGEEFSLSSKLLKNECEKLGTCGFFGQEGNKVVVSGHKEGKHEKRSFILSTAGVDRSFIEDHNIVALPIIEFEQLETDDNTVLHTLMYVEQQYSNYCFSAAEETYRLVGESKIHLRSLLTTLDTYEREYAVSYDNFMYWQKEKTKELLSKISRGDVEGSSRVAEERKTLYDDLKTTIECGRSVSKVAQHSGNSSHAVSEKLNSLRVAGSKYVK